MKRVILTKQVDITGPNFFGFKSTIRFVPLDEPGWFLIKRDQNRKIIEKIPIDYRIASYLKGRINLKYENIAIPVWEHIGALRFSGIDCVGVEMLNGSKWPPYLGGAGLYYKKLSEPGNLKITNEEIPVINVKQDFSWMYSADSDRSVSISKGDSKRLVLDVSTQWKPFPRKTERLIIDQEIILFLIKVVFPSKPQGYPKSRFYFASLASFFGWPNLNYISWPNDYTINKIVSYDWWLHRVQDLLGDLSLADHLALPVGYVHSFDGGHLADLTVVKNSFC